MKAWETAHFPASQDLCALAGDAAWPQGEEHLGILSPSTMKLKHRSKLPLYVPEVLSLRGSKNVG